MAKKDNRWCLICNPRNRTLYWHTDEKTGKLWCYCNKCNRGYSLVEYCKQADLDVEEFLKGDFHVEEADDTVNAMSWPASFIPLSDPRAIKGVEYIKSRGLSLDGDMYFDIEEEGIVFPYYFENQFVGAQIRFVEERVRDDGSSWKITTMSGTRLGLLFGLWNQSKMMANVKAVVVCEGYFNAMALQQAFNLKYGGISHNPWKFCCTSGSGVSDHQAESLRLLKEQGYKVFGAFDADEAGIDGLKKMIDGGCLTHYSSTLDPNNDWNDVLKSSNHADLANLFLKNVQHVG